MTEDILQKDSLTTAEKENRPPGNEVREKRASNAMGPYLGRCHWDRAHPSAEVSWGEIETTDYLIMGWGESAAEVYSKHYTSVLRISPTPACLTDLPHGRQEKGVRYGTNRKRGGHPASSFHDRGIFSRSRSHHREL